MKYYILLWGVCLILTVGLFAAEQAVFVALTPVLVALAITLIPSILMYLEDRWGGE